jgi:hypothetical protein
MTTVTFDPLVGKTCECDENGRITYYEYDDLGRMVFVKDQFKNILKRICYNYAGMPENCDNYFYLNSEKSNVYTKNDCHITGGVVSGTVTYTVPQGRYSSLISKEDADAKAEYDLNTNGQKYANDNGTCCYPVFTFADNISSSMNQTSLSGSTILFNFVFTWPTSNPFYIDLGNIASCGRPTSTRTIPYYVNNTLFHIIVSPDGDIVVQHMSGTAPSGTIGLSSKYDLNVNAFYSSAKSGMFTRNNCPAGQIGTSVPYSIKAYAFSSLIDQPDAEQQAQTALNVQGQNNANTYGTCNTPCTFTPEAGMSFMESTVTSSGSVVSFDFIFESPTSNFGEAILGTISTGCRPSQQQTYTITDGYTSSRTWYITFKTSGSVEIRIASGGAVTTTYPPIRIQGTFNL